MKKATFHPVSMSDHFGALAVAAQAKTPVFVDGVREARIVAWDIKNAEEPGFEVTVAFAGSDEQVKIDDISRVSTSAKT